MRITSLFKSVLLIFALIASCGALSAQEAVREPEFSGEAFMLFPDNTVQPLEKSTVKIKTRLNAGAIIVGIGSERTKIAVRGKNAQVVIPQDGDHKLIVRAVDNNSDPMRIISIFRFDVEKKERKAEVSSEHTFGKRTDNKFHYLPYSATKYGEASYLISLNEKPAGEYGIIVRNPNALDEGVTIVLTFAIE